jgi:protein gp37
MQQLPSKYFAAKHPPKPINRGSLALAAAHPYKLPLRSLVTMAKETGIAWADSTFNPWIGCTKVGPGCDHCYAEARMDKRLHIVNWGAGAARKRTSAANWREPLKWDAARAKAIAAGENPPPHRVFCASLADVFDNEVDPQWRADLFALIRATPNLTWLILTKRIGNAAKMLMEALGNKDLDTGALFHPILPNVWIGATVINQTEADRDIPKLLTTPAAKRFLSIEPMLGPIDLTNIRESVGTRGRICRINVLEADEANPAHAEIVATLGPNYPTTRLDWIICGFESGKDARPGHPDWVRSLRDQCAAAGVAYFFKQWGEWAPLDHFPSEIQEDYELRGIAEDGVVRIGTKKSGNHLDGRQHLEFPQP